MLTGEKVDLVAAEPSYVPMYVRWINDPEVTQWLKADPPFSAEMEHAWVDRLRREGRVDLVTDADNHRALRAYRKCEFKEEGMLRQYRTKKGRAVDCVMMAVLAMDWFVLHPPRKTRT